MVKEMRRREKAATEAALAARNQHHKPYDDELGSRVVLTARQRRVVERLGPWK